MTRPEEFEWVKDGLPVWYRPSLSSETKHSARVGGTPWAIGGSDGTWVVHLIEVDPSYRSGRGSVASAYLGALEPREETARRRPRVSFERGKHTFWLHTLGSDGHPYPTQRETTLEDLRDAIADMETMGDYELFNRQLDSVIDRLNRILDEGKQHGTFGGEKLQAFAERILRLRVYPNLSWEMLVHRFTEILDTGEHRGEFHSEAIDAFAKRLVELRGHPDPGFGVDPKDSAELCALRQACDDHLVWPSEAQREGGDYLAAVEYSGKLARFAEKWFKDQQQVLKGFPQ